MLKKTLQELLGWLYSQKRKRSWSDQGLQALVALDYKLIIVERTAAEKNAPWKVSILTSLKITSKLT